MMKKILFVLLITTFFSADAKVTITNGSAVPNAWDLYEAKVKNLYVENKAFQVIFNELKNRPKNYIVWPFDHIMKGVFNVKIAPGTMNIYNCFVPEEVSGEMFNPEKLLTQDPISFEMLQELQFNPVIAFEILYDLYELNDSKEIKNIKITEDAVVFQEFFHAYQHDIQQTETNVYNVTDDPKIYKVLEVEGELANQIFGPQSYVIWDTDISKIPNLSLLKDYFIKDMVPTDTEFNTMNQVINKISDVLVQYGYQFDSNLPITVKDFYALKQLTMSIKNY